MSDRIYKCINVNCNAKYNCRQHLWRHKKTCKHPASAPTVRSVKEPVLDESGKLYMRPSKHCSFTSNIKASVVKHFKEKRCKDVVQSKSCNAMRILPNV